MTHDNSKAFNDLWLNQNRVDENPLRIKEEVTYKNLGDDVELTSVTGGVMSCKRAKSSLLSE
jgi:hypothetical protein